MNNETIVSKVKTKIRDLSVYQVKASDAQVIEMNKNENPYDIPQNLKREILDYAMERSWSRYPPLVAYDLYESIASYTGWMPEGVVAGNGSDEMILTLMLTFLEPGKTLVVPTPSFPMFSYIATLVGADTIKVPLNPDYTYDCDLLEETISCQGDMLIICSPNNPTGTPFPLDRLEGILQKTNVPVIVDEAYFEFSGTTALDFLKDNDNLIIFRTFSKAFSLASMRVGYALMAPELAREVGKVKLPFNLDFFSIAAASKLLEHSDVLHKVIEEIVQERERLSIAMKEIERVTVYPSAANFILFKTPYDPGKVFESILADGILVRNLSADPALANTLRVTTSKPSDNEKFINALARAMRDLS